MLYLTKGEKPTNLSCHHLIKHQDIYEGWALESLGRLRKKRLYLNNRSHQGRDCYSEMGFLNG